MNKRTTRRSLATSAVALICCIAMLLGTTFAWFTDSVTSAGNKIQSGNLKIDLFHKVENDWVSLKENTDHKIFDYNKWEPGYTKVEALKVVNLGNLALQYKLSIAAADGTEVLGKNGESLADVIDVYVLGGESTEASFEAIKTAWTYKGTLSQVMANPASFMSGELLPTGEVLDANAAESTEVGSKIISIALHMQESAGNEYQNLSVGDIYVSLVATQYSYENDSFGNEYDKGSEFPRLNIPVKITVDVETDANGLLTSAASMTGNDASAYAPEGVKVDGDKLTFTLNELDNTQTTIKLGENEEMRSLDVHVEGVAEDNTVPIIITIPEAMMKGLNATSHKLIHVENGQDVVMNPVSTVADVKDHNDYYYDPATGDVTMALKSFSEVATVANTENPWTGNRDYSWYSSSATTLTIANAEQLAGLSAIVGSMDGRTQDSFKGKTIKLACDISIGDLDSENERVFYPIGYWNNEGTYEKTGTAISSGFYAFEGTFDGNGYTISDWYQNTWEMKGDNNYYDAKLQYYRDGMGLFGKVYGGTVKNLTVENFSSDGEYTTTGTIAAYADCGATFENIAIFDCNPRVYNIGNGGIVGCVGWYTNDAHTTPVTFKNITVDNSNKISALWGSWDVACGGVVGQYYPTSGQSNAIDNAGIYMENCHVSAQIDVYNDVCANYQYYAYRYAGMLIGSVRENVTQNGRVYPNMDGISFTGCTVHYGTWNDYYYCELVDNTTASYTHDYQMSRLTEVKSINGTTITYLNGTTGTVPTSGRANYVVVDYTKGHGTENATCYHFKDGEVWTHDMGGIQTGIDENGDGQDDLKEDKQHIYREFNQLVTGYGWGVTSKGVDDFQGVTILDVVEAGAIDKFEVIEKEYNYYETGTDVKLGDLFKAATISDSDLAIKSANVKVTVSPVYGTMSDAGATYNPNTTDWTKGTLTFTGTGEAVITITDYYFCKTTKLYIEVTPNSLVDITIEPDKDVYTVGDSFNDNNITVTAKFSDGTSKVLKVGEFTLAPNSSADGDFTKAGVKYGTVTCEYYGITIEKEFFVVVTSNPELELEVEGVHGYITRYFDVFAINGMEQNYPSLPGSQNIADEASRGPAVWSTGLFKAAYNVGFNGGSAIYMNSNGGKLDSAGEVAINGITAPEVAISGYVGYANKAPIAFAASIGEVDNFISYSLPIQPDADEIGAMAAITGTNNNYRFRIQAPLDELNLGNGTYKVYFVAIFEDGIAPLTSYTVNVGAQKTQQANVIILAGQSNAMGVAPLSDNMKNMASATDYSNIFIHYNNIHKASDSEPWRAVTYSNNFVQYAPGVGGAYNCFGPELGLARYLATNVNTKDQIWYIVKYTAPSSFLQGQWQNNGTDPNGLVTDMGGYLTDLMNIQIDSALAEIAAIHGGYDNINMHSLLWMQGESDATNETIANNYQANEATLVNTIRDRYAQYACNDNGDNIAFVTAAIAGFIQKQNPTDPTDTTGNDWRFSDTVNLGKGKNADFWYIPNDTAIGNILTKYVGAADTRYNFAVAGVYDHNSAITGFTPLNNYMWMDTSALSVQTICTTNPSEKNHDMYCVNNNDAAHYCAWSMFCLGDWFGIGAQWIHTEVIDKGL